MTTDFAGVQGGMINESKKNFCALLTLVTIISGSVTKDVYADEPSFLSENTQIIEKSLEQSDINVIKVSKDKDTIIHNNGYAMESDYFENGKMREIIW